jgi:hypothetical protein
MKKLNSPSAALRTDEYLLKPLRRSWGLYSILNHNMHTKSIISLIVFGSFIVMVLFLIRKQEKQKKKFINTSFRGKVVSSTKAYKGYYHIRYLQGDKANELTVSYGDSSIRLFTGDSILKNADSEDIYAKGYEDTVFIKADLAIAEEQ